MIKRTSLLVALPLVALSFVWVGCSSHDEAASAQAGDDGPGGGDANGGDGNPPGGGDPASETDGGASPGDDDDDGAGPEADGGAGGLNAGNPDGSCAAGLPARAKAVDTSKPTTVVGTGTPDSCTFASLSAAITKGGIVTFDCGSAPVSITVNATLKVPVNKDTVIDGGGKVTLDGKGAVRIMTFDSPGWQTNDRRLTLQHIALVNGKTTPTEAIPTRPAPCSQGFNDGEGGALYVRDGNVTIVGAVFEGNQAALLGPDTGGGGIYIHGSKQGIVIAKSTFKNNKASNGAGVACLFANLEVYDSLFTGNQATGRDANNAEPSKCSFINNGQNQTGSGGNGGALYSDGISTAELPVNVTLCGDAIESNAAGQNAFGGGIFFTSNNMQGSLAITDSTVTGNTGGSWTNVSTGSVTYAGTAVGTNARSITITNSKVQGVK